MDETVVVVVAKVALARIEHVAGAATIAMAMANGVVDAVTMESTGAGRDHRHDTVLGREHAVKPGSVSFLETILSELTRLCVMSSVHHALFLKSCLPV